MMTLVMKFGGTSVGSAEAIQRATALITDARNDWSSVVAVCSAMSGVTDLLLRGAQMAAADRGGHEAIVQTLRDRHERTIGELLSGTEQTSVKREVQRLIDRYAMLCRAVRVLGELSPRALDVMSSIGERMSARIVAAALRQQNVPAQAVDATELIVTDANYQAAAPQRQETAVKTMQTLQPLLNAGITPIVTGFMGATADGVVTTLGRGGSDYSAAILAEALAADELWIWTDVDGVMSTDPRIVPDARSIPELTYREVAELAFFGAKVLHPKTIRPVIEANIPLRVKNTFKPDHAGTLIVPDHPNGTGHIKAVTAITDLSLITIEGRGMLGVPGIAARAFGAVARQQVSVLLISQASSEQSICFAAPDAASDDVIAALELELAEELARRDIDRVWAHRPVTIITIVGAGMRATPGIAGRIFGVLGEHDVNIIAIAQGSSECSISLVVDSAQAVDAVAYVHALIARSSA